MRAEILVGRERRRRWSADDKLQIVREAFAPGARVALVARRVGSYVAAFDLELFERARFLEFLGGFHCPGDSDWFSSVHHVNHEIGRHHELDFGLQVSRMLNDQCFGDASGLGAIERELFADVRCRLGPLVDEQRPELDIPRQARDHGSGVVAAVEAVFDLGEVAGHVLCADRVVGSRDGGLDVAECGVDPFEGGRFRGSRSRAGFKVPDRGSGNPTPLGGMGFEEHSSLHYLRYL